MKGVALVLFLFVGTSVTFPSYRDRIPNGRKVPNPCKGSTGNWEGVGHNILIGGGPRNVFGKDFASADFKWTPELCGKDSDSDGKTNGQELGDPNCTWTKGGTPSMAATGHPGVCEPMDLEACKTVNAEILCL
ncbi:temptin-like [Mizuhopecten yessoensis]|uniref:temptin-like n=1 Tax=Mizuhopecten yessoensis TaxID=6573 RepID=UPI000B45A35F|nr:temptin-like [Mizuhopecten yessoensis]